MRTRTPKRAREERIYRTLVQPFLEAKQYRCEWPEGCFNPATQVHHARGRRGPLLLDERWWRASCHFHNDAAETDTGRCLANGWLLSQITIPEDAA